ncbi:MAG: class I SAM-dependent methyltransferase [Bacteroidetes bacterium]|nr:class I SAM-dependent methyltransferase [Bacteroidota bacterium]
MIDTLTKYLKRLKYKFIGGYDSEEYWRNRHKQFGFDIRGCGIGFYTNIFKQNGCKNYIGLDITDTLFAELGRNYPTYTFVKKDITEQLVNGKFDVVIMIDVTQHITEENRFKNAMMHIKDAIGETGIFIVTSWLLTDKVKTFYEKARSIENYRACFPGYHFSEPVPFRDKFIFTIRK